MPESLDQEIRTLQAMFWSERDPEGLAFAPLADAFRRNGDVRQALDLLTDGMSRHPDYATGHVIATRLYRDQGMDSEAELAARRVRKLDPENLVALSTLVSILAQRGETDEAEELRAILLASDPDSEEARSVAEVEPAEIVDLVPEPPSGRGASTTILDELALDPPMEGDAADEAEEDGGEDLAAAMDTLGLSAADEAPAIDTPGSSAADEASAIDIGGRELDLDLNLSISEPSDEEPEPAEPGLSGLGGFELETPADVLPDAADLDASEKELDVAGPESLDEPDGDAVDVAALAPDEPDEDAVDVAALAPDGPDEDAVDVAALAPDEPDEDVDIVEVAVVAPNEPVLELDALAFEASPNDPKEKSEMKTSEPVYTRTLADLYVKQGFVDKALEVLRYLRKREPGAADLQDRIDALERGDPAAAVEAVEWGTSVDADEEEEDEEDGRAHAEARSEPEWPSSSEAESEGADRGDDVETLARDLAESGHGDEDVDTPFAWNESASAPVSEEDEPAIGRYFEALLDWENRNDS